MVGFDKELKRDMDKILRKKSSFYFFIGILIIFLFFLFRGCSDSVSKDQLFHIGRQNSWPSVNLMGKEKNVAAFTDELLSAIAMKEHLNMSLTLTSPNDLMSKLQDSQFDAIITNLQPEPAIERQYVLSNPFFLLGPVMVVPTESELDTWEELKYKIIGIMSQSPILLEISKDASIRLKLYDDIPKVLSDLFEQKIDGAILPALPAYIYIRSFYPGQIKIATSPLNKDGLRLVALKTDSGKFLIDEFNKGLAEIKTDGIYQKLIDNWGLVDFEHIGQNSQPPKK
ncbi:MAG: transporter substrate-binding domain-containing protein [Parachlamydiaceae bacterium]|nr:transporter substrate-binding domain-containing protein [Parachlamydiaceae bacterium]